MRPVVPILVLLAACDAAAPLPLHDAPPPGALTLSTPDVLTAGATARVRVDGAAPGATVWLGGSGSVTGVPACPPPLAPLCLDLSHPVVLLGAATANAQGRAQIALAVPAGVAGREVFLQAVSTAAGTVGFSTTDVRFDEVTTPGVCPPASCGPGGLCDVSLVSPVVLRAGDFAAEQLTGTPGMPWDGLCAQTQVVAGSNTRIGMEVAGDRWLVTVFEDLSGNLVVTSASRLP